MMSTVRVCRTEQAGSTRSNPSPAHLPFRLLAASQQRQSFNASFRASEFCNFYINHKE